MEFKELTIGEVCRSIYSGGTPKSTNANFYALGSGIPWLNTKEVNFNRIYSTEKYITQLGFDSSSTKWVEPNAVIVAMYGATAGRCCISKIRLTTNQACCNLSINDSVADYRYVYYYLCNEYNNLAGLANGGAQQNLNTMIVREFPIRLPSLKYQRLICDLLSVIDDKIENNIQINKNLQSKKLAV